MKYLIISTKLENKADSIGSLLSSYSPPPSLSVVEAAAKLSKEGYLTRVKNMIIKNINMDSVPHAACLGDIQVDGEVIIDKVEGNIGRIVAKIKCRKLSLSNMQLSVGATHALVAGMDAGVEVVQLGLGGTGSVEVDMDTLATYGGQGRCRILVCWEVRYRDEVGKLAERFGWCVKRQDSHIIRIESK